MEVFAQDPQQLQSFELLLRSLILDDRGQADGISAVPTTPDVAFAQFQLSAAPRPSELHILELAAHVGGRASSRGPVTPAAGATQSGTPVTRPILTSPDEQSIGMSMNPTDGSQIKMMVEKLADTMSPQAMGGSPSKLQRSMSAGPTPNSHGEVQARALARELLRGGPSDAPPRSSTSKAAKRNDSFLRKLSPFARAPSPFGSARQKSSGANNEWHGSRKV